MQQYHDFITNSTGSNAELPPPVEIAINKNNIGDIEKACLPKRYTRVILQGNRGFTILGTDV